MIHMVTRANAALYAVQLKAMHQHRREVFIDKMKWDLKAAPDGGEYDAFDDDKAIYLMGLDADGEIECCLRVRPTDDASIINDYFPHSIMAGDPANTPHTWELSRYYARGEALTNSGFTRRSEMRLAALEAAQGAGVRRIVALTEIFFWEPVMRSGWNVKALGLPFTYGEGGEAIAFEIGSAPADITRMRERLGMTGQVLQLPDPANPDVTPQELEQYIVSMAQLSASDQKIVGRMARRLAEIEDSDGVDMALAVAERMENIVSGRAAV